MSDKSAPPESLLDRLQRHEDLVWWDRPAPNLILERALSARFLVAIAFLSIASLCEIVALLKPGIAYLLVLPFVFVGIWLVSEPWRRRDNASSTIYALTNERAIIMTKLILLAREIYFKDIEFVEYIDAGNGAGHVLFFYTDNLPSWAATGWSAGGFIREKGGFFGISDAKRISCELSTLRDKARGIARESALTS